MAKVRLIELKLKDKPGTVAEAMGVLGRAGVNVRSVLGWGPQGVVQLTVDNFGKATRALRASGMDFTEGRAEVVELRDEPGSLHRYLERLAKRGTNLRSIAGSDGKTLVWTASD